MGPGWNSTPCLHCPQLPASVWNLLTTSVSNTNLCTPFRRTCMHACKENGYGSLLFVIHCSPHPNLPPHPSIIKPAGEDLGTSGFTVKKANIHEDCSLYSWNFQLDNGGGSCRPCHHPCRFNEFAAKSEMWKEKPRPMCLVNIASENSCGCTALDMLEWREMTKQIDWRAKEPTCLACCSQNIWSVEELETLPTGTKPRTSHHWLPGGERCGKP